MKLSKISAPILAMAMLLTACGTAETKPENNTLPPDISDVTEILLSDESVTTTDTSDAVYTANDIVYYQSGTDFTYGEGTAEDAHSAEEADAHTVVHITQPGTYRISGTLSRGQIAVDLGKDAVEDPSAVVTLILNGVDITCEVAPAVIFYNVYECGSNDADNAVKDVDTSTAGANVIIADGTVNTVNGSYVARIYKPDSVVLNEAGTKVEDAKKLHKYDGAFYSKMSMNIFGGQLNSGVLTINAENEGLDTELHLTINGGTININSGNDGINTNEDGVSVTTINGGTLNVKVTGETGEGDGIDSNGWLVINGGTITAAACSFSADAGIDSDMGIHINGGTVIATGHMLDHIQDGGQNYAVFNFSQEQNGDQNITLKAATGKNLLINALGNGYSVLVYSSPNLSAGTYTLWSGETQLAGQSSNAGGMGGMGWRPGGTQQGRPGQNNNGTPPGFPEGMNPTDIPEGMSPPDGGFETDGFTPSSGGENPTWPNTTNGGEGAPTNGGFPSNEQFPSGNTGNTQNATVEFVISNGANMFSVFSLEQ